MSIEDLAALRLLSFAKNPGDDDKGQSGRDGDDNDKEKEKDKGRGR